MGIEATFIELAIMKGVLRAPGDSATSEQPLDGISLIDPDGIAVDVDGFSPQIAGIKAGGTFAESAIADGRQLLAASLENAVETMQLFIANRDLQQRQATLKKLLRLAEDAQNFHVTQWAIEPVWLALRAASAPGPQYALLYRIDIAQRSDIFDLSRIYEITLSIEREPLWRGIPPGANPLEWTFEFRGIPRGSQEFDTNDMDLGAGTDHLIYDNSVGNHNAWNPTGPDAYVGTIVNNFIDIPAENIPGDAPALLELDIDPQEGTTFKTSRIYVARWSRPTIVAGHSAPTTRHAHATSWAAGDTELVASATKVLDASAGLVSNGSGTNRYYVNMTLAAPGTIYFGFRNANVKWDSAMLQGTYAVWVRNAQQGGAQGDVDLTLTFHYPTVGGLVSLTGKAHFSTASGLWGLSYLGTVTIPPGGPQASPKGFGLDYFTATDAAWQGDFIGILTAVRATGAATLQIADLIMLPLDEWLVSISSDQGFAPASEDIDHFLLDETGYIAHGKPDLIGLKYRLRSTGELLGASPAEVRGPELTLLPNTDTRLYFLHERIPDTAQDTRSDPHLTLIVRGNVVPRWRGIRDE